MRRVRCARAIAVIASAVGIAACGQTTAVDGHDVASVSRGQIGPALIDNFGVLRRPLKPSDRLPGVYRRTPPLLTRGATLLPALARQVDIPNSRLEMWLEPSTGLRFCIYEAERSDRGPITGGFGADCGSLNRRSIPFIATGGGASLINGPPVAPLAPGKPDVVSGLVTDSVTSVTLTDRKGTTTPVPLAGGMFAVRFQRGDHLHIDARSILLN